MPSSAPGPPPAPILKTHASRQKWTQPKWGMQTMIMQHEKAMPSAKPSHLKVGLHADGISGWHIHARRIHKLFIVDNGDDFTTQMARKLIRWISRSKTERQENSFQLPVRSLSRWRALQMHHAKMRALKKKTEIKLMYDARLHPAVWQRPHDAKKYNQSIRQCQSLARFPALIMTFQDIMPY